MPPHLARDEQQENNEEVDVKLLTSDEVGKAAALLPAAGHVETVVFEHHHRDDGRKQQHRHDGYRHETGVCGEKGVSGCCHIYNRCFDVLEAEAAHVSFVFTSAKIAYFS